MDLSALESAASALEKSLDSWEFWLAVATLLVVVGLILEYWHEVKDLLKARPVKWKSVQKILGAILVTVVVAGALAIQYESSAIGTKLRSTTHDIEGLLSEKASKADERSKTLENANLLLQA